MTRRHSLLHLLAWKTKHGKGMAGITKKVTAEHQRLTGSHLHNSLRFVYFLSCLRASLPAHFLIYFLHLANVGFSFK